jgi:hypothetical protein
LEVGTDLVIGAYAGGKHAELETKSI